MIFETADLLRINIIHGWNQLPEGDVSALSQHLLNLLLGNPDFSYSVKRRIAGVIALIVKHQSVGGSGKQRSELVNHIVSSGGNVSGNNLVGFDERLLIMLINLNPLALKSQVLACCILDALLAEHQFVVHSNDASLTYEMHFAAKKDFENSDLLKIFQFCLQYLSSYQHTHEKHRELDHILKLIEGILCWNFSKHNLHKRVAAVIEMEACPSFKPPPSWMGMISENHFVLIFFDVSSSFYRPCVTD